MDSSFWLFAVLLTILTLVGLFWAMLKFERCAVCGKLTWKPINRSALAMDAAGNLVLIYLCHKHYLQYLIARNEPEPTDDVEPDA